MFFWKVEISEEGGVFSAEQCEAKGTNGRRVIYVEANTKAEACDRAKAWWARKRRQMKEAERRFQDRKSATGMCRCGKEPHRPGRRYGELCHAKRMARQREIRAGAPPKTHYYANEEQALAGYLDKALAREKAANKRFGGGSGRHYDRILRKLDAMGPVAFRAWLVAKIEAKAASAQHSEAAE